MAMTAY